MKKSLLSKNLYHYQFPPHPGKHFGFNIFVLVHQNEALLIDTGFEEHALAVKKDLMNQSIKPTKIIISHFHDDHIYGLQVLKDIQIYGSGAYQLALDLYTPVEKHECFRPNNILTNSSSLVFGEFQLTFRAIPGHSACGVYSIINNKFIHIGDDIMCSNNGTPLLPSCEPERISEHIDSLTELKQYCSYTILLGHGNPIMDKSVILEAIDNRLKYLESINCSSDKLSFKDATKHCNCDFLHKEWHEFWYE